MTHCTMHTAYVPTCPGCQGRKRALDQHEATRRVHEENRRANESRQAEDDATNLTAALTLASIDTSTAAISISSDPTPSFAVGQGGQFDGGGASGSF